MLQTGVLAGNRSGSDEPTNFSQCRLNHLHLRTSFPVKFGLKTTQNDPGTVPEQNGHPQAGTEYPNHRKQI